MTIRVLPALGIGQNMSKRIVVTTLVTIKPSRTWRINQIRAWRQLQQTFRYSTVEPCTLCLSPCFWVWPLPSTSVSCNSDTGLLPFNPTLCRHRYVLDKYNFWNTIVSSRSCHLCLFTPVRFTCPLIADSFIWFSDAFQLFRGRVCLQVVHQRFLYVFWLSVVCNFICH